jgi:hypothetical protein
VELLFFLNALAQLLKKIHTEVQITAFFSALKKGTYLVRTGLDWGS